MVLQVKIPSGANVKHKNTMFSCNSFHSAKAGWGWSVPVLLFPGNQELLQLLKFVFILTHCSSLDVQLSPQSRCFVHQLLLPLLLRRDGHTVRREGSSSGNLNSVNLNSLCSRCTTDSWIKKCVRFSAVSLQCASRSTNTSVPPQLAVEHSVTPPGRCFPLACAAQPCAALRRCGLAPPAGWGIDTSPPAPQHDFSVRSTPTAPSAAALSIWTRETTQ